MRQAAHIAVAIFFWVLLAGLWVLLALQGKASGDAFRDTGIQLAALIGAVLAITTWWVRHNVGIYRRKGPRRQRPEMTPRTDADRLGHALRWETEDGATGAAAEQLLVVALDGDVKTYRREG